MRQFFLRDRVVLCLKDRIRNGSCSIFTSFYNHIFILFHLSVRLLKLFCCLLRSNLNLVDHSHCQILLCIQIHLTIHGTVLHKLLELPDILCPLIVDFLITTLVVDRAGFFNR